MGKRWRKVAISSGSHLERMMQMYQELGFEVRLEKVSPDEALCLKCYADKGEVPYKVYVRSSDQETKNI
jgi:hypothetical protein